MKDEASERRQEELINRMGQAISQMNGAYAKAEKLMGLILMYQKCSTPSRLAMELHKARYATPTKCRSRRSTTL